jgi:hypothetical protein
LLPERPIFYQCIEMMELFFTAPMVWRAGTGIGPMLFLSFSPFHGVVR